MAYQFIAPAENLKHIVKHYMYIDDISALSNMIFLPNGGNFLIFNRGIEGCSELHTKEQFPIPSDYSIGIKTNKVKKFIVDASCDISNIKMPLIIVELLPVGVHKLFNVDASKFNTAYAPIPSDVIKQYFSELYSFHNFKDEIAYLNNSLTELYQSHNHNRLCIEDVVDRIIHHYHYDVTVSELVEEFGCSRSTMERQFKKIIGLTPKNFIFVSKFCKTLIAYVRDELTLNEIQYRYSDNAHLNAVFKNILGRTPSEILKEVSEDNLAIYQIQDPIEAQ
jgi:AraC-like DNA-binding protein